MHRYDTGALSHTALDKRLFHPELLQRKQSSASMLWADPPRQVSPEGSTGEKTQKSMQMHVFAIYPDCFPFFLFSLSFLFPCYTPL